MAGHFLTTKVQKGPNILDPIFLGSKDLFPRQYRTLQSKQLKYREKEVPPHIFRWPPVIMWATAESDAGTCEYVGAPLLPGGVLLYCNEPSSEGLAQGFNLEVVVPLVTYPPWLC